MDSHLVNKTFESQAEDDPILPFVLDIAFGSILCLNITWFPKGKLEDLSVTFIFYTKKKKTGFSLLACIFIYFL